MSDPEDLRARAASIFRQLRTGPAEGRDRNEAESADADVTSNWNEPEEGVRIIRPPAAASRTETPTSTPGGDADTAPASQYDLVRSPRPDPSSVLQADNGTSPVLSTEAFHFPEMPRAADDDRDPTDPREPERHAVAAEPPTPTPASAPTPRVTPSATTSGEPLAHDEQPAAPELTAREAADDDPAARASLAAPQPTAPNGVNNPSGPNSPNGVSSPTGPTSPLDPTDPAAVEAATWAATRLKLADLDLPELQGAKGPETPPGPPATSTERPKHPSTRHPLPRVLAIANQKGGVGKTTTAVNLGAGLAELGYRTLVVDLDPQGNASTGLGVNARNLESSVYDVILHDVPMEDVIEPTTLRNLFVVPATIDLAGAEIELVPAFSRELRLKRAVESVSDDYDFVVIDCPPSLGLLTVNGLAAAGEVVVPIQCEYYALEGLGQLLRNVNLVKANLNQALEVSTIVLTMYDARTRLAEQVVQEVREHFGDRVCRNVVPRTVRLSEAPSFGQPIIVFDPSSRGAIAYRELAKEVSGGAPQRIG